jgi:hypothetical protein
MMQTLTIRVHENVLDKVRYLLKSLSEVEIVAETSSDDRDIVAQYPAIGFEEAQQKVAQSVASISHNRGRDAESVFEKILA